MIELENHLQNTTTMKHHYYLMILNKKTLDKIKIGDQKTITIY